MPLTNRAATSTSNQVASPEPALAMMPRPTAMTIARRLGRRKRPAVHEATLNPSNWVVEMMPTDATSTPKSSAW